MQNNNTTKFLSFAQVKELTGLSRTSIYMAERRGEFPRRYLISVNRVAWRSDEIEKWLTTRKPVSLEVKPKTNIPRINGNPKPITRPIITPVISATASETLQEPLRKRHWTDRDDD